MIAFLIVIAVLILLVVVICSLSATITLVYDKGWSTKLNVLFIEKDIVLSEILSFLLFPEKKAEEVKKAREEKEEKEKEEKESNSSKKDEADKKSDEKDDKNEESSTEDKENNDDNSKPKEEKKPNAIMKIWNEQGVVGIVALLSNVVDTVNSAVLTLIRGLHIYSLYVMILVGGGDADVIARSYGTLCKYYYPLKGWILSDLKVDNYDDVIQPDFLADSTEFEMQLIASINVGLLLKVGLKALFIFVKNLIKDKK